MSTYWNNIIAGVDAITEVPEGRIPPEFFAPGPFEGTVRPDHLGTRRGGFVDDLAWFDPTAFGVMPVAVAEAEPDQLLALRVAAEAVDDAGGMDALGDPERVAVILGRGGYLNSGVVRLEQRTRISHQVMSVVRQLVPAMDADQLAVVRDSLEGALGEHHPESSIGLVPNLAASRVANRLDLGGPAYTVDAACASSLLAVDQAVAMLRTGAIDAAIVGGVHHCHDVTFWSVFSQLGALSDSGAIRPFSRHADGLLIGEGTGMVVLRRAADAAALNARTYAVVHGSGTASDGRGTSLFAPRAGGQLTALRRAWADAALDPQAVGLIEAHGTATAAGDAAEIDTLTQMFGPGSGLGPERGPLALGSVKSMIGHCMPAAGIAGVIKAALAVHHRILPPTLHAEEPNDALAGTRFELLGEPREWGEGRGSLAAVNAFGFGGINAHLILGPAELRVGAGRQLHGVGGSRESDAVMAPLAPFALFAPVGPAAATPIVALTGPSSAHLAEWLADARPGESLVRIEPGPARLVILDPNERRLAIAERTTGAGTAWRGRNDVWHVPRGLVAEGGKVAFVYPGVEPSFAPQVDGMADALDIFEPGLVDGTGVGFQGANIVHLGRFLTEALRTTGVRPDVIAGHSVGEWTAMIASGLIPEAELERLLAEIDPASLEVPGVEFVALGCGVDVAAELLAEVADVFLTHDNCPHQSVACGPSEAVARVVDAAKQRRVMAQVLPFRSGFHSPVFEPYLGQVRAHLDGMRVVEPHTPLWSATTASPYPRGPQAVRALGIRHLLEPVRFRELVRAMYAAGVRAFVQVGVGSLPGFIADTLSGDEHLVVSAGTERDGGLAQLNRVRAALWAEGAAVATSTGVAAEAAGNMVGRFSPTAAGRSIGGPSLAGASDDGASDDGASDGKGVMLALGAPQLRIDPNLRIDLAASRSLRSQPTPGGSGVADVLRSELDALRDEAMATSAEILAQLESVPGRGTIARTNSRRPSRGVAPSPAEAVAPIQRLRVSLTEMPWLMDHCFYRQPADATDPALRFPVVPMTAICELMMDLAAQRVPGSVPIALTEVRALRWLPAEPAQEVAVSITEVPAGAATAWRVVLEGFARGTVHLAHTYPARPSPRRLNEPSAQPAGNLPTGNQPAGNRDAGDRAAGARAADVRAEDLYEHRWMFHGPRYQGVSAIPEWFDTGLVGQIEPLNAPGAVLDCAGQLMGLWAMQRLDVNVLAFPQTIASMRFFGPRPDRVLECQVAITEVADRSVTADMELAAGGEVWCRVDGWEDRRFDTDEVLWPFLRFPETRTVLDRRAGGWWLLRERWSDSASRELLVRRYATSEERLDYDQRNPLAQRDWLAGRAVAKDAVRQWLWAKGSGPRFPVEVVIGHHESGAPCIVDPPEARHLSLSIGHTKGLAVAQLADAHLAGIDIERVEPRTDRFGELALSREERNLAEALASELGAAGLGSDAQAAALTVFWSLKEAAAKASRRGLEGRPKDWRVREAGGGEAVVDDLSPEGVDPQSVRLRYALENLAVAPGASLPDNDGAPDSDGVPDNDGGSETDGAPGIDEEWVVVAWVDSPAVPAQDRATETLPGEPV